MPLDLVARARSMDGSADLKWRNADRSAVQYVGLSPTVIPLLTLYWPFNAKNHNFQFF